jgi:maleylpyruvate isomerase
MRLLREIVTDPPAGAPPMTLRPYGLEHPLTIGDATGAPVVGGPTRALAAWLSGRGDGTELTVAPDGPLPTLIVWM